jgi:hypothetical protein
MLQSVCRHLSRAHIHMLPGTDWGLTGLAVQLGDVVLAVTKPGAATGRCHMRLADYADYASRQVMT